MTGRAVLDLVLMGIVLGVLAVLIGEAAAISPPANVFPLTVLGISGALVVTGLVRSVLRLRQGHGEDVQPQPVNAPVVLAVVVGLVAYGLLISLSYVGATVAFLFAAYLLLSPRHKPRDIVVSALAAVLVTAFTYVCFAIWLGVNLSL